MMVARGDGAGRAVDACLLPLWVAGIGFREESRFADADTVLCRDRRAGAFHVRSEVSVVLHSVPLDEEVLFPSGDELDESSLDAAERGVHEGFLAVEDGSALVVKVEHVPYGEPGLEVAAEEVVPAVSGVRGLREDDFDAPLGEHREEAPAGRIGPVIGTVQDAAFESVSVGAHLLHPAVVVLALVLGVGQHGRFLPRLAVFSFAGGFLRHDDRAVGLALLYERSPGLELVHVLDLDDVRVDGLNVAEEMLRKGPGIGVT